MRGVAALPMYDLGATRAATETFWSGVARACRRLGIGDAPGRLRFDLTADAVWRHPRLLLAQTCGYPFTHALHGRVKLVATPIYRARGCAGPCYRSLIVVRDEDPATSVAGLGGRSAAVNSRDSQSGHVALRAALAEAGCHAIGPVTVTGSHLASIDAVRGGRADMAAIDAVIFALLARHEPARLGGLRVLGESPAAPGLPFVTAATAGEGTVQRLRAALRSAMEDPALEAARDQLLLDGVAVLLPADYRRIHELERRAATVRCDLTLG